MGGCTEALALPPLAVIGRASAAVLGRANGLLVERSGRRNSRCMRSTMGVKTSLAILRSTRPNFIPRSSQFASRRDFGVVRWTITPTKASQPGAALTASVIVDSSSSAVFETRLSLLHHFFFGMPSSPFLAILCKISNSSANQAQAPGIKIQVNIALLLRLRKACPVMQATGFLFHEVQHGAI